MANGPGNMSPAELKQLEELKRNILVNVLTKESRERMNRIRLVKPDLAMQIELYLIQLHQSGRIKSKITDQKLKDILKMLRSDKDFKIVKK